LRDSGAKNVQLTFAGWQSSVCEFCRCATTAPSAVSAGTSGAAVVQVACRGDGREQTARGRLDVALGARDLPREPDGVLAPRP